MLEITSSITEVVQILHFISSHYLYLNGILVSLPYVGPFEHTCCLESLLSVALYLDYRGEDESILDTARCVGDDQLMEYWSRLQFKILAWISQ